MAEEKYKDAKMSPPRWADRFLEWYCAAGLLDEIQGDLYEAFYIRAEQYGSRRAKWLFVKEVLLFFRPSSFEKNYPNNIQTVPDMYKNYFKIAYRNLAKSKVFSLINIFGLAIGLAASFLIVQYIHFESNYDRFHENIDRIHRVTLSMVRPGEVAIAKNTSAVNHPAVGPALLEDFPQVEAFARAVTQTIFINASSMTYEDGTGKATTFNEERMYIVDPSFLTIFSFPFVAGNAETALTEPQAIVISESTAKKYFGTEDPIGKVMVSNGELPLTVRGVFKDIPENSHIQFDILISFLTLGEKWGYDTWIWPEFYTYVLLAPDAAPQLLEEQFPSFVDRYMTDIMTEHKFQAGMHLQPVADIHLTSHYQKEARVNGSSKLMSFLSILAAFILFIAWINYVNLSTVKALDRAREVGLRKVVGAARSQLIGQFLLESLLINLFALLLSLVMVWLVWSFFQKVTGKEMSESLWSLPLWQEPWSWGTMIAVVVIGALLVGLYPAWMLSSFRPIKVLKGSFHHSSTGISLRKALVSFQFFLTIILIIGTVTVYKQLSFMRDRDLGYAKDQLLAIRSPAIFDSTITQRITHFKTGLSRHSSIRNVTTSTNIPGETIFSRNNVYRKGEDKSMDVVCFYLWVDPDFIGTFDMNIVAGRGLQEGDMVPSFDSKYIKIMINEALVDKLGYKDNQDVLNEIMILRLGMNEIKGEVIGVVKNYHQRSLQQAYDPILFYYPGWDSWKYLTVNLRTDQLEQTMDYIEQQYQQVFPGNALEYFFVDDYFDRQYEADQRFGSIFTMFTTLAIVVSCLGLFGLSAFVLKQRTKEIGIRKVLGASIVHILRILSQDFVKLMSLAFLIALPISYFTIERWLSNYAFHIEMDIWLFVLPIVLMSAITLITVSFHTLKAALTDPVKSIQQE
ncbi:MAG: ABC transporter permease [Bacteroidota bacterium]